MDYNEFLTLLQKFFKFNNNLKYLDDVTIAKDFNDIINDSFPILNLEPTGVQFEKHPELQYGEYQKVTYKVYFTLGTQNDSYTTSVIGKKGIKGIVDLIFDFKDALKDFETAYRYKSNDAGIIIKLNRDEVIFTQRNLKLNQSGKFLACAEVEVEFYLTVQL